MLQEFLFEFNGFNRLGRGFLYELTKDGLLLEDNISTIISYLQESSLSDALLLVNKSSFDPIYAGRIVKMSWLGIQMEKIVEDEEKRELLFKPIDLEVEAEPEDDEEFDEDEEDEDFVDEDEE